jgi:CBS domain-containing protein
MTTDFPHVNPNTSIYDFVHDYLLKYDYSAFPVTEDEQLAGIITVGEVRDIPLDQWAQRTVREIARPPEEEQTIDEYDDAFNALMHMAQGSLNRLLVMHEGRLKGMVTQESIFTVVRTKLQLGM